MASLLPWLEEVAGTWRAFFQLKHTRSQMDSDQSCIQLIWRAIQFLWPPCAGTASVSSNVTASWELTAKHWGLLPRGMGWHSQPSSLFGRPCACPQPWQWRALCAECGCGMGEGSVNAGVGLLPVPVMVMPWQFMESRYARCCFLHLKDSTREAPS